MDEAIRVWNSFIIFSSSHSYKLLSEECVELIDNNQKDYSDDENESLANSDQDSSIDDIDNQDSISDSKSSSSESSASEDDEESTREIFFNSISKHNFKNYYFELKFLIIHC